MPEEFNNIKPMFDNTDPMQPVETNPAVPPNNSPYSGSQYSSPAQYQHPYQQKYQEAQYPPVKTKYPPMQKMAIWFPLIFSIITYITNIFAIKAIANYDFTAIQILGIIQTVDLILLILAIIFAAIGIKRKYAATWVNITIIVISSLLLTFNLIQIAINLFG